MVKNDTGSRHRATGTAHRWAIAALTVLLAHASVAQNERVELPDLGASAGAVASPAEEAEFARGLLRQMRAYNLLVEDPLIRSYFEHMGYRVVAESDQPERPFTFVVLNEPVVNAFAAPGGFVALFRGMILAADNEDEVAGVLAHEVAHVTQMHAFRAYEEATQMTIPLALAMLGMVLAGGGSGQAIQGALVTAQGLSAQQQINYTRQNEYEADRLGIQTLSRAGYDPEAMATMFEKLGRVSRSNGEGPPEYLRTHPVSTSRIADAKNRAHSMPALTEPRDSRRFYLVQARLRALTERRPEAAVAFFDHALERETDPARRAAHEYGLAIAQQRRGHYDLAAGLLEPLIASNPNELAFQLQMADLDVQRGRADAALERLSTLYHDFSGNHALAVAYAEALIAQDDPAQARIATDVLRQELLEHQDDPRLYELYARSANEAGDDVRASEAIAESYYQRGGVHEAVVQLEKLSRRDDLDYYQRARVTARLTELRIEMLELGRRRNG